MSDYLIDAVNGVAHYWCLADYYLQEYRKARISVMVGTAFKAIGLGLASAVGAARAVEDDRTLVLASGDGGFLMGLADLESLIGAARSAIVVIYNDAVYGAEIYQYGFRA